MSEKKLPPVSQQDPNEIIKNWEAYKKKLQTQPLPSRPAKNLRRQLPQLSHYLNHKLRLTLMLVVLIFTPMLLFGLYEWSSLAQIKSVSVSGQRLTAVQTVIEASKVKAGQGVLTTRFHHQKIEQRVTKKLKTIKSANLTWVNWNEVTLKIREYTTIGWLETSSGFRQILSTAYVDQHVYKKPVGNFPVFQGFSTSDLAKIVKVYQRFSPKIKSSISEVDQAKTTLNPYRIKLTMNDGNVVIADQRTVVKKLKYYAQMVTQTSQKGTFDLEIGAYFTPYSSKK